MSNVSVDMLEQELCQEELQNSGIHATFAGFDGTSGEHDEIATYFMEAAHRAKLMYRHVPPSQAPHIFDRIFIAHGFMCT